MARKRTRKPKASGTIGWPEDTTSPEGSAKRPPLQPRRRPATVGGDLPPKATSVKLKRAYPSVHRLAAAQAVLAPLCDVKQVTFPPRLETVQTLQALWEERVAALANAGWEAMAKSNALGYARNCPCLAFAMDPSERRPCKQDRVCPFCYALRVEILFENLNRALRRYRQPVELFLNVSQAYCAIEQLTDHLAAQKSSEKAAETLEGMLGIITRTTVFPTRARQKMVAVRQSRLLATVPGTPMPSDLPGKTVRVRSQTPVGLAWAVSRLAAYPVGLLLEDATASVTVLNAVGRGHLSSATGLFRTPNAVKTVEQIRKQEFAPAVSPELLWDRLAEEELLVARLNPESTLHEAFAVRSLLHSLGLPITASSFVEATGIHLPVHWIGHRENMPFLTPKERERFARLVQQVATTRDFALVYLAQEAYWVVSTVRSGQVNGLPLMAFGQFAPGGYTLEPLGQFAARLQTILKGATNPQRVLAAWRVANERKGKET